jgi:hypothetical protein
MTLATNLNANAGDPQFHAGLPLFASLLSAFSTTLDRNSFSFPLSRFDTLLFANCPRTLLPTHTIGHRLWNQCCGSRYRGGNRKGDYHSHETILFGFTKRATSICSIGSVGRKSARSGNSKYLRLLSFLDGAMVTFQAPYAVEFSGEIRGDEHKSGSKTHWS